MKRFLCLLFLFSALTLNACSHPLFAAPPEPVREFTANVKVSVRDKTFEGRFESLSYADLRFTLTSPDNAKGTEIRLTPDGYLCTVDGMTDVLPAEDVPENACVKLLLEGVRDAVFFSGETTANANGGFHCEPDSGKYNAVFSGDGSLTLLYSEPFGFSASFYEVCPL